MNESSPPRSLDLFALFHTAHAAQAEVEASLNALGLSLPKLLALEALADESDGVPLGQLADRLSCVKSNITQLVDRLEAEGLVARRPDPDDRRTKLAVLTDAGRKACAEGTRARRETEQRLLATLSADEARQLAELLGKVGRV